MNFEYARENMVENQVRAWEVLDKRVLEVLGELAREDFVPPACRRLAYTDQPLPLAHDQFMMKPVVEGRLLQSLSLTGDERVLEIGTGTGYLTACLAELADTVTSLDIYADFVDRASARLAEMDYGTRVDVQCADALTEFRPDHAYDAIAVTGAVPQPVERFSGWLASGGRLFTVTGQAPAMEALLITRTADDEWMTESLFETDIPYLVGAEPAPSFAF